MVSKNIRLTWTGHIFHRDDNRWKTRVTDKQLRDLFHMKIFLMHIFYPHCFLSFLLILAVVESITKEVMKEVEDAKEEACSTLLMCIVTTLNHGLRSGGGIGDILRPPSIQVRSPSIMQVLEEVLSVAS